MDKEDKSKQDLIQKIAELQERIAVLENELQQETDFSMKIIQASPTFFITLTPQMKILLMNETMLKALNYKTTEVVGKDYIESFVAEEDRRKTAELFQKLLSGKTTQTITTDILSRDRQKISIEWYFNPVLTKDNLIDYIFGIGIKLGKTAAKQESSEVTFRILAEQSPNMIFINRGGRIMYANKKCEDIMGYTREEFYAPDFDFFCLIAPESIELIRSNFARHMLGKEIEPFEYTLLTKNGEKIEALVTTKLIDYNQEKAILGIITDITERKRVKEAYRSFVDNALVGVYKSTLDGKIIYANEALATMFEFDSPEEMMKQGALSLYKNEADRELFLTSIKKTGKINYYEVELLTKKGKPKNVLISATLTGNILSGMIMDITERKNMEKALRENIEKLRRLMENTVDSMASILETRDPYTAGHQQRVAHLALAIANEMQLSEDQIMGLNMAAVIHDIGKIYIPAEILTRPTHLTESEFTLIKIHPEVGYDILKKVEFPWPVAQIILQHHERLNGSGYPHGLKGDEIMIEARILAVADVVEAMSSHRPYRPARTLDETLEEITKNKGILYDADVVDACLKLFKEKGFKFKEI